MLAQQRAAGLPEGMLQLPPGMLPHMLPNGQLVPPPTPQQIAAARAAAGLAPLTLGAGSGGAMAAMGTAMLAQHASAAGSVCAADGSPLETLMLARRPNDAYLEDIHISDLRTLRESGRRLVLCVGTMTRELFQNARFSVKPRLSLSLSLQST